MGVSIGRLVRDRLVNDATIRGFFTGVATTATASLFVGPVFMEQTAIYPRITYSESFGATDPGMSGSNGRITFSIETQATGGVNPHSTLELINERVDQLFDDQLQTGLAISGTSVYSYLMIRDGGPGTIYNENRKTYERFVDFSYKVFKY